MKKWRTNSAGDRHLLLLSSSVIVLFLFTLIYTIIGFALDF